MERKILRTAIFIAMSFLPFLASCKKEAEKDKGPKAVLISIDKTDAELEMYSELRLEATVYPTEQKFTVNWKSEDKGVATVDAEGVVRGVSLGTVKIKASVAGLAKTAECMVNIKRASVFIKLDKQELSMEYGSTYTLKPSLSKNFENIEVKWSSSNENVATVDNNGKVTARKPGNTVIKVEVPDGFFSPVSAECNLEVYHNYIENGVNFGRGKRIGGLVWAPVNCGYEPSREGYRGFELGKYYQWGRKAGHPYPAEKKVVGPVDEQADEYYSEHFVVTSYEDYYYWLEGEPDSSRWNAGTEDNPIKTENDPCPEGWRVPTAKELRQLVKYYKRKTKKSDYYIAEFKDSDGGALSLPAAGYLLQTGEGSGREQASCIYWSSSLDFNLYRKFAVSISATFSDVFTKRPAEGGTIRCILEQHR